MRVIYLPRKLALTQSWFFEFYLKWTRRGYTIKFKEG